MTWIDERKCKSDSACGCERERVAQDNLAWLFRKLAGLYTGSGSASLSRAEALQLAASLSYQLGLDGLSDVAVVDVLCAERPDQLLLHAQERLARKVDAALERWREVCAVMPAIRNVALRDTLASIGELRRAYDTYFAAHEVPCSIDYPLSCPVDDRLQGIDYVQAWLDQLFFEASYIVGFTLESCIKVLEYACPDYRGLHVNLYDLLRAHESELVRC